MKMIQLSSAASSNDASIQNAPVLPIRTAPGKKVALPTLDGYLFKRVEKIAYLEAQGNYTSLQFEDGSKILVCKTLSHTETMLKAYPQFIRIHRSFTINLNCLAQYIKGKGGYVILENGQSISVSNSRKAGFLNALKCYFGYPAE